MVLWSTANCTANHNNLQAICLATSGDGKCALVSRRHISIILTKNPSKVDSIIARETKWDTTYAEFSPPEPKQMAITNSQTINIYNIDNNGNLLMHTLGGHTRTITDLNWSFKEPSILASASYDNYIYIWDLREIRKPVYLMHSISGATQIKWSKLNENILATSHEGDVRIWDKRKSNMPLHYVSTHLGKINGIDWSPFYENKFLTCSQDGNIKLWDLTTCSKGKSEYHKLIGLPIWKARYTPFGNGILTALVPQMQRTGENNSLWMWNIESLDQPIHFFSGHLDVVLDFGWNINNNDYELITWARDNTFRLFNVDSKEFVPNIQEKLNDEPMKLNTDEISSDVDSQSAKYSNLDLSKSSNLSSPLSEKFETNKSEFDNFDDRSDLVNFSDKIVFNLKQEFSLFNANIPNINIEELNITKRTCIASIKSSNICRLKIFFPVNYPNTIPQFSFLNESTNSLSTKHLNDSMKKEILKTLQATATLQVQRNRNCLEKCLRQFVQTIEKMINLNVNPIKSQTTVFDILTSHKYGSYLDASVPFPRTSGARFCSSEILVCFGRPPHLEQMNVPTEYTPRSLSALSAYLTTHVRAYNDHIPSISSFYIDSSKRRSFRNHKVQDEKTLKQKSSNLCGPVMLFMVSKLLPISRLLAEQYLIPTKHNIITLCEMNAKVASTSGRRDLFQTWYLVRLSAEIYLKNRQDLNSHWSRHPFGGKMIKSMIEHYVLKCNDIQTAAMIASVISACKSNSNESELNEKYLKNDLVQNVNDLNIQDEWTIIGNNNTTTTNNNNNNNNKIENKKSGSSGSINEYKITSKNSNNCEDNDESVDTTFDKNLLFEYDYYKILYSEILYKWKLIKKRAQLLKTIETEALIGEDDSMVSFKNECNTQSCKDKNKLCSNYICSRCNKISLICTICRLPVKGATNHCVKCGHGGHTIHMHEWFQTHIECPTGCGCECLKN